MMEKLERLGKRLRPRPEEGGEQSRPAKKGLRWYHKAFVVATLALAIFGTSLTISDQAQADHQNYWGQCFTAYGTTWYGLCWIGVDHATGQHYELGYGYWQSNDVFRYEPHNRPCEYWLWFRGGGWVGPWPQHFC